MKQGYPLAGDANRKRASSPKAGGKMPYLLGYTADMSENTPLPSHTHTVALHSQDTHHTHTVALHSQDTHHTHSSPALSGHTPHPQ